MKLHASPASPYVRKVRVVAVETGLADRLELVAGELSPVKPNATLNASNPLGKIPALVLDDGTALYDSRVICEYLDTLHAGSRMFPGSGAARWTALRRQALADGILDAAVSARYETALRPEALRWADWVEGQRGKFRRALDALETEAGNFDETLDIGTIAIGCALGYLDFRYPDDGWRGRCPELAKWFDGFAARPSMKSTAQS